MLYKLVFRIPPSVRQLLFILYLLIIAYGSLASPQSLPGLFTFPHIDKVLHFLMYFIFCIGGIWAIDKKWFKEGKIDDSTNAGWWTYALVFIFAVIWGFTMEVFQRTMHLGRDYSMFDMAANITGALIGAGLYWFMFSRPASYRQVR